MRWETNNSNKKCTNKNSLDSSFVYVIEWDGASAIESFKLWRKFKPLKLSNFMEAFTSNAQTFPFQIFFRNIHSTCKSLINSLGKFLEVWLKTLQRFHLFAEQKRNNRVLICYVCLEWLYSEHTPTMLCIFIYILVYTYIYILLYILYISIVCRFSLCNVIFTYSVLTSTVELRLSFRFEQLFTKST